jgi:hypothetical protein
MKQERVFSFIFLAILIAVMAYRFWFALSQAVRVFWHSRRTDQIGTKVTGQNSNRSCLSERERLRKSPSVPRGAPQCRHLIGVEEGACSEQSKTIPRPLQILQTMLKPHRGLGAICDVFPAVMVFLRTKPSSVCRPTAFSVRTGLFSGTVTIARRSRFATKPAH